MLPGQRHQFAVPREVAYFNNASSVPLPEAVRLAGQAGVAAKSMPWAPAEMAVEAVRAAAARCIGATANDIALAPSVAYGVATAVANLPVPPGSRILVMAGEFPSLTHPWAHRAVACGAVLDVVPRPPDGDWTAALLARLTQPGLPPVAVAALTPLHWTDGALADIAALAPTLRDHGAALVLDATQAAGILPIDAPALGADFVMFPTYKWLMGPYTLAFLYAAPHRQGGVPLERHGANHVGGAEPFDGSLPVSLAGARRYDMGERLNPVTLPMALAGMDLLHGWGMAAVAARLRHLTDMLASSAEARGWTPVPRALRPPHILGLRPPPGVQTEDTVARLATAGVHVAARGGVMRLGVHVFNDEEDVARFVAALG